MATWPERARAAGWSMRFRDRSDAGRRLAARLAGRPTDGLVALGLPRGGVPVAYEVGAVLRVPLDVILVRKVGLPLQPELAMGAVGEDGVSIVNEDVLRLAHVDPTEFDAVASRERGELERRARVFRAVRPRLALTGRTALIVDDGIATGSTARAACRVARVHGARHVTVATPIAASNAVSRLRDDADDVVALETPRRFGAIGEFYDDFTQLTDADVVRLLTE